MSAASVVESCAGESIVRWTSLDAWIPRLNPKLSSTETRMELLFAHSADYAGVDGSGKLTIVGAFDIVWDAAGQRPIPFPPFYLVAAFEASIAEGADHEIEIRLVDDDEVAHSNMIKGGLQFRAHGVGHQARAHLLIGFGPGVVTVPELGDYYFRFKVGGAEVGGVRVSALAPPTKA